MPRTQVSSSFDKPFLPRPPSSTSSITSQAGEKLVKNLKYIVVGGAGAWWTDVRGLVGGVLENGGRGRKSMRISLGLQGVTVLIFLYLIVFLPYLRGYLPNYPLWQQSRRLRLMVPLLTFSILIGWISFVWSLRSGTGIGFFKSFVAATSIYLLIFGLIGLIPTPEAPIPKIVPASFGKPRVDEQKGGRRD